MHLEYFLCINYAKIHIKSHNSAYAIAFFSISVHFVQRKHTRMRHLRRIFPEIPHICSIYAAYFSAHFAKFRIFSPHILHQNGPHILRKISAINWYP